MFSRSLTISVWFFFLARPNAVLPFCDGEGEGGGEGGRPGGRGRGLGGAERGGAAPRHAPPPPPPRPSPQPPAPPSSALCAIAHLLLEARVGPRLEQRLDAGSVAVESRVVQRRELDLPRRGGGPTHAGERWRRAGGRVAGACGGCDPVPPRAPHRHSPARSPAGLHTSRAAEGRQPAVGAVARCGGGGAQRCQRGTSRPRGRGAAASSLPRSPLSPHTPRRHAAAGPRRTLSWVFRLAPLAMRCSRQSSLPVQAASRRAVVPYCGGAAAARHAVSGGGEGGAAGAADGEGGGRGAEVVGGGWLGGAHCGCGLKVGALGDEVLEADELAFASRPHEGRHAVLRRRGGGATRGEQRR